MSDERWGLEVGRMRERERRVVVVRDERWTLLYGGAKNNGAWDRTRYSAPMTADEVRTLPLAEKIQLMEALWLDLRERFERMELSEDQKALLDGRRAAVEGGVSRLHDWDAVKATIGRG